MASDLTIGIRNNLGQRWNGSQWLSSADYVAWLNSKSSSGVTSTVGTIPTSTKVILYSPNGGTITVDQSQVSSLLSQGWLTSPLSNPTKPYVAPTIPTGTVIVPPITSLEPSPATTTIQTTTLSGLRPPTNRQPTIVGATVKLGTGELVDQSVYNKLTVPQKQYLSTSGIDAFNTRQRQILDVLGSPNADGSYTMEQINIALREGITYSDLGFVGFDAAAVEKDIRDYRQGFLESQKASAALGQLEQYKVTQPFIGPLQKGQERPEVTAGYDLQSALSDGVKPELLVAAGFTQKDIQTAQSANTQQQLRAQQEQQAIQDATKQKKPTDKTTVEYWESKGLSHQAAVAEAQSSKQAQSGIGGVAVGSGKPDAVTKPESLRPPTNAEWSLMLANMEYAGYSANAPKQIAKMTKQWVQWFQLTPDQQESLERRGVVASAGGFKSLSSPETAQMAGGIIPFAQARTLPDYIAATLMVATPFAVESFGKVSGAIGKSSSVGKVVHPSEIEQTAANNPELASLGKTKSVSVTTVEGLDYPVELTRPEYNLYKLSQKGLVVRPEAFSSLPATPQVRAALLKAIDSGVIDAKVIDCPAMREFLRGNYSKVPPGSILGFSGDVAVARSIARAIELDVKGNSYGFTRAVESFGRDAVKAAYPTVDLDAMLKSEAALMKAREPAFQEAALVRAKATANKLWDRAVGVREASGVEDVYVSNYSKSQFRNAFAKKGYILSDPKVTTQVGELINRIKDTPNRQALVDELATHKYTLEESYGGGLRVTIDNPTPNSPWSEPFFLSDRGIIADAYEQSVGMIKEYLGAERKSGLPQKTWGGKELVNEFGERVGESESVTSMAGPYTKSGEGITYAKVATKEPMYEPEAIRAIDPVGNMVGSKGEVATYKLGGSKYQVATGIREGIFNEDGTVTVSRAGTRQSAEAVQREMDLLGAEREASQILGKKNVGNWQYPTERVYRESYEVKGDTLTEKAENLVRAIDSIVKERGFADAVSTFGLEPVRAVYPDALQYSLMEQEQALFRQLEKELGVSDPAYRNTVHDSVFRELDDILRGKSKPETAITETMDRIDYNDYLTERRSGGGGSRKPLSPEEFDELSRKAKEIAARDEKLWTISPEERAARVAASLAAAVKPKTAEAKPETSAKAKTATKTAVKEKVDTSLSEITPEEVRSSSVTKKQQRVGQEQLVDAIGKTAPTTESVTTISPVVNPNPDVVPNPKPTPDVIPTPTPNPVPAPVPQPVPEPVPTPNPVPQPVPQPIPQPVPKPAPVPVSEAIPSPVTELARGGKFPIVPIPLPVDDGKGRFRAPVGSIVWKQGLFWKFVPPPYERKPITTKLIPRGARLTGRTPKQTLQIIGGRITKETVFVDMGIVVVRVSDWGNDIDFFRSSKAGRKTEVVEEAAEEAESVVEPVVRARPKYTVAVGQTKPKRKSRKSSRSSGSGERYMDEVGSFVGW